MNTKSFKVGDHVKMTDLSEPSRSTLLGIVTDIADWQNTGLITISLYIFPGRNLGEITISANEIELLEA